MPGGENETRTDTDTETSTIPGDERAGEEYCIHYTVRSMIWIQQGPCPSFRGFGRIVKQRFANPEEAI